MPDRVISGTAVASIAAGVVLAYAGFRGTNPLAALRDITSGHPTGVADTHADLDTGIAASSSAGAIAGATAAAGGGFGGALVAAAIRHAGERYSQVNRWKVGWSDCSSFVGKSLKDIGITPPPFSLAASYVTWPKLGRIPRTSVAAGDLIANTSHIIIATSRDDAIGQQNSQQNVQRGRIEDLMWGTGAFLCLRYKGSTTGASAGAAAGAAVAGAR